LNVTTFKYFCTSSEKLYYTVAYNFTALVQRIFNCGEIWNISLTLDEILKVCCIDYTPSTKSSTLENRSSRANGESLFWSHGTSAKYV